MKTIKYLSCVAFLALSGSALAFNTTTWQTAPGAMSAKDGPVSAQAVLTTSANGLTIVLTDLLVNPTSVGQLISDFSFTLSNVASGGSLTSSSGLERTVHGAGKGGVPPNGTFTDGSVVDTGWSFDNTSFHLNVLGTAIGPKHLIIGDPAASGLYSAENGSIAGNGPHNPFLAGDVTFNLNIPGITTDTTVTSVTFSFGTTPGDTGGGGGHCTSGCGESAPDGGTTSLLLGFALTGLGVMRRYLKV